MRAVGLSRRLLIPEVIQTSAMDCGVASIKALLEGFGIPASYGRLREACQTDVDGTSIDVLEEVASQLGLDAEQIMLPRDYVLAPAAGALPAIAVVRLPNGFTHFVVLWRAHGPMVQIMDPAGGRRWVSQAHVTRDLYSHTATLAVDAWRDWAISEGARRVIADRLRSIGFGWRAQDLIDRAVSQDRWRGLATLDASSRMVASLVAARGVGRGHHGRKVLESIFERASAEPHRAEELVPPVYWSTRAADEEDEVRFQGAVLVRVNGRRSREAADAEAEDADDCRRPLSAELAAAISEPVVQPGRRLLHIVRQDGLLASTLLAGALVIAAAGTALEALLFRALLDVGRDLSLLTQRLPAIIALVVFLAALLVLELPISAGILRAGRRLETRLRLAFLEKLPRLGDRYLQSRLVSDMAERSHSTYKLRLLPSLAAQLARAAMELLVTAAAIVWLDPPSLPVVAGVVAIAVVAPILLQRPLAERDLRVRSISGALSRFYLDALLGLFAVRTHGAEPAIRREHESLLVEWAHASRALLRSVVGIEAVQSVLGFALAGWLMLNYVNRSDDVGSVLLLVYWSLNIPALGQEIAVLARQYPGHRNSTLRLLEPLGAPEEARHGDVDAESRKACPSPAAAISFENVTVRAAGHTILRDIDVRVDAGSHVAIVGASGAGKSTFVGLLLGWHRPATGRVAIDGGPLDGAALSRLRSQTAWVDPSVQLWNRPLLANLDYGCRAGPASVDEVIEQAELRRVVQYLPEGLQTVLGEGGGLLSGGEGQRVRFGRAIARGPVRLAVLDEPFRGLTREQRRSFLDRTRERWRDATLFCITHDVGETLGFDRVVVIEDGRVVEDAAPAELAARAGSRYRELLDVEHDTRTAVWGQAEWKRLHLVDGSLVSRPQEAQA